MPDDVIVLKDGGDTSKFLMKRWYHMNKEAIDAKISQRIQEEELKRQKQEEETKYVPFFNFFPDGYILPLTKSKAFANAVDQIKSIQFCLWNDQ